MKKTLIGDQHGVGAGRGHVRLTRGGDAHRHLAGSQQSGERAGHGDQGGDVSAAPKEERRQQQRRDGRD